MFVCLFVWRRSDISVISPAFCYLSHLFILNLTYSLCSLWLLKQFSETIIPLVSAFCLQFNDIEYQHKMSTISQLKKNILISSVFLITRIAVSLMHNML